MLKATVHALTRFTATGGTRCFDMAPRCDYVLHWILLNLLAHLSPIHTRSQQSRYTEISLGEGPTDATESSWVRHRKSATNQWIKPHPCFAASSGQCGITCPLKCDCDISGAKAFRGANCNPGIPVSCSKTRAVIALSPLVKSAARHARLLHASQVQSRHTRKDV